MQTTQPWATGETLAPKRHLSRKADQVSEFAIGKIMRLALEHQAVDLAVGAPDFPTPDEVKEAAVASIRNDLNQYAHLWGARALREAIADRVFQHLGLSVDPEREITVTCGSTEAMFDIMMLLLDPGDEVIIFKPFYETYVWTAMVNGATVRYVPLHRPDWHIDPQELAAAFGPRTKAIVLNTPNNPTGKTFNAAELALIATLCEQWDVLCIADEVYDHLLFDGRQHLSPIQLPGMRERTILVNSLSKTYSITGWRIGYVVAPEAISGPLRKIHDLNTAGTAAPLQAAGITALQLPESYYQRLRQNYQQRRDRLTQVLQRLGLDCYTPQGASYLMASISPLGFDSGDAFVDLLIRQLGVAAIPGSCFYPDQAEGQDLVRFCFGKAEATLEAAERRLERLRDHLPQERALEAGA